MFEDITQLPIGFIVALSGVLIPGPLLAFIISRTLSFGPRTGTLAAGGHILVELVILVLIALGVGAVFQNQIFQVSIGLMGGASLILLASRSLLKIKKAQGPSRSITNHNPVFGGVLFSTIFNPTVIIWWATIGTVMLMEAMLAASYVGVAFWLIGHVLADLSWFSFVSYSVAKGKVFMGTKGHKTLLLACGILMLIFGVYFILRYAPTLINL